MDGTLTAQEGLKLVIKEATHVIQATIDDEWTDGLLISRLEMLDRHWGNFEENHVAILQSDTPRDHPYFLERDYGETERAYTTARGRIYDVRARLHPTPLASSTHIPDNPRGATRLPRIVIPSFSGQREDWKSFRDLFRSLIHEDSSLSNVDKLYYLKTHVQGDARFAIDDLPVTAANYATAWNNLEARYDHRRLLVQDHLKALKTLRPLKEESSANLQHLLDELKRHRNQLRILGRPVDSWDDWLVLFASDAMDPVTRRDWEEELETLDAAAGPQQHHHPSFAELSAFLQRRCRTLRSLGLARQPKQTGNAVRASVPSTSNPRGVKAFATTTLKCSACDGPHYLGHCPRFKGHSAGKRRDLVTREQLCFNCLRQDHRAESCPSQSSCRTF